MIKEPTPKREVAAVLTGLILVFLLPTVLTLLTVEEPRELVSTEGNPTPYGYTWSLTLFLVPSLVLGVWFRQAAIEPIARTGFWCTVLALPLLGFVLDFLLGHLFFEFTYPEATIGLWIPVLGGDTVPIEEFVFYVLGFIATLLIYVWADEYWLRAYNVPDYELRSSERGIDRVESFWSPFLSYSRNAVRRYRKAFLGTSHSSCWRPLSPACSCTRPHSPSLTGGHLA